MPHTPSTGRSLVLPPLISYGSPADFRVALETSTELSSQNLQVFEELSNAGLPPLVSPTSLAVLLGVSPKLISAMSLFPRRYYRAFDVRKRSGGKRRILAPRTYLKVVQKFVLRRILEQRALPKFVTGFVKSKGIVENASAHLGSTHFLNIDLKDFFTSVRDSRVIKIFRSFGYPPAMANTLMRLCTYDGCLPQGAPTSPYLANLAFLTADAGIVRICDKFRIKYTRYADDLTFSCRKPFTDRFLNDVERVIIRHDFEVNRRKTRYSGPGQANYVTGLVVSTKVQAGRSQRRLLRAMFHNAYSHPERFGGRKNELEGWASYVNSYDRKLGKQYLAIARSLGTT